MNTVDFLPPSAFATHLERRRTPTRIAIVALYAILCTSGALAVNLEAQRQETKLIEAESPNTEETVAGQELRSLYIEMSRYADRLDPLSAHLRLPVSAPMLSQLGEAAGEQVLIEKISWEHKTAIKAKKVEYAEVQIVIEALAHGDRTLLDLPERLRKCAGMVSARTESSELVPDLRDTMRAKVRIIGELLMPGMTAAKLSGGVAK